jgi:hypothetical protein
MLSRIARKFHLPEEKLRTRLGALRRESRRRQATTTRDDAVSGPPRAADLPAWDRDLLELLLVDPSLVARVADVVEPTAITSDAARRIYAAICQLPENAWRDDFGRLLAEFDDPDMKSLLVQLDESCATKRSADRERWLADLLETNRRRQEVIGHRARLAAAREDASEAEQLLAQFCEQTKSKHLNDYERRKK